MAVCGINNCDCCRDCVVLRASKAQIKRAKYNLKSTVLTYMVDGFGQQVFKSGSSGSTGFFYDEAGRLLGEYNYSGNPIREYVYLGDLPVGVLTDNAYVLDNTGTGTALVGTWASVSNYSGNSTGYDFDYRTHAAGSGSSSFTWTPTLPASAVYQVYARWATGTDRATNATYEITHLGGTNTVTVNQQQRDGEWVLLGGYSLVIQAPLDSEIERSRDLSRSRQLRRDREHSMQWAQC